MAKIQSSMKRAIDDYECIEHEQSLMIALRVIEEMSKGWKGGATQSTTIGDAEIRNLPVLNVAIDKKHAYEEYLKLADEDDRILGEKRLGYPSFSSLFSGVTRMITAKHALSYYYVDALDVSSLQDMVNRLNVLWDLHHVLTSSPETYADYTNLEKENITFQTLKTALKQAEEHIKYGIRPHITMGDCSGNALHCANFAVGINASITFRIILAIVLIVTIIFNFPMPSVS